MKSISVTKSFKELGSALMTSIRKRFTATLRPLRRPRNTSLVPLHPIKVADISTDERFKQCCLIRAAAFGVVSTRLPAMCLNALDWMSLGSLPKLPKSKRAMYSSAQRERKGSQSRTEICGCVAHFARKALTYVCYSNNKNKIII